MEPWIASSQGLLAMTAIGPGSRASRSVTWGISPASHRKAAVDNDDDDEKRAAHDLLQEGVERRIEIEDVEERADEEKDRKSTRLNSSHSLSSRMPSSA